MLFCRVNDKTAGEWTSEAIYPVYAAAWESGGWRFLVADDAGEYHNLTPNDATDATREVQERHAAIKQRAQTGKVIVPDIEVRGKPQ